MDESGSSRRGFLRRIARVLGAAASLALAPSLARARQLAGSLDAIGGRIIRRGDADFESWRASMVWYLFKPRRYPRMIVRAESEQDVIEAVRYARDNGLRITVRATGHNPAGAVLRDDGLLIDLSGLRRVEIDTASRTAWVQPGIRSEEFIELTRHHGLAFPAAHTGIVGLGGYLIGGGLGWNMPLWGIACHSILAAEIITADGNKVLASAEENSDLLWALRGAGPGFFGAIVCYRLQLFPLPQAITKSKYLVPVRELDKVTAALETLTLQKQQRLELLAVIGRFYPPEKPVEQRELVCAISAVAFGDTRDDALSLLEPVDNSAIPALSVLKKEHVQMSFPELFEGQETDYSSPLRTAVENIWTDQPGAALKALAERIQQTPPRSPQSFVLSAWGFNPGKPDQDMSFSNTAPHYVSWYLMASSEADIEPNFQWMDEAVAMLKPLSRGHYINEINPARYPAHVRECFAPAKWERMQQLRKKHDPQEVFHTWLGHA